MAYVVPRTDSSKYASIDLKSVPAGTAIQTSAGGLGYVDPQTNTFIVLDALPAARTAVTDSIANSDYINATAGFTAFDPLADTLTTAEAAALAGNASAAYGLGAAPDTTPPVISGTTISFDWVSATNGDVVGTLTANEPVTWSGTFGPKLALNTSTGVITIADASLLTMAEVFTIPITATDAASNTATANVTVNVT